MEGNLTNLPLPVAIETASVTFLICVAWYFVLSDMISHHPKTGILLFTILNFITTAGYYLSKVYTV